MILLLAGTAEARALSHRIAAIGRPLTTALAGATTAPAAHGGTLRTGGFGGAEGLAGWLRENRATALIDATHPFAARISANAAQAAKATGTHYVQLVRPPWPQRQCWRVAEDLQAAADAIAPGARALLATGHRSATTFAHRRDITAHIRVIDPQPAPPPIGAWLVSPPPHDHAAETATFKRLGIDTLVARNSGGQSGTAKLDVAEALGITTIVVAPPPLPDGARVHSIQEALAWISQPK